MDMLLVCVVGQKLRWLQFVTMETRPAGFVTVRPDWRLVTISEKNQVRSSVCRSLY